MMFLGEETLLTYGYMNEEEKEIHAEEMKHNGFDIYKENKFDDPITPYVVTYSR